MKPSNLFIQLGRYLLLMRKVFSKPEKAGVYLKRIWFEMDNIGTNSIGITTIISLFMGAVAALQITINLQDALVPPYLVSFATREILILEFSSTVVALILAGKVGSSIASEIGTMKITQQIDALEVMGVNSASYLILPKIIAGVLYFPLLDILSIVLALIGAYVVTIFLGFMSPAAYVEGLMFSFDPFSVTYSMLKISVFGFIITSVSGFFGYYTKDNSLEVGRSSTRAVVVSSITILITDLILTQLLLMR